MADNNVAVLIDYENVGLDAIQHLLDQISDVGRVIVKRAYADWSAQRSKRDQLLELGVEAVHHFRSTNSGKNSSDIVLAIDAVDLLYGAPVDTFVIVSSDSDFVPLVSKLRAAGKSVIGSGRRAVASATLVKSCDRYIYLDDVKPPAPVRHNRSRPRTREAEVESLVARALQASMDDEGKVVGSKLYQTMTRIDPSFDFKALGHRTFTQFLSSCKNVTVARPSDASDVIVQFNHSSPQNGRAANGVAAVAAASAPPAVPAEWDRRLDTEWAARKRNIISGRAAAADAAKALGVQKLSASRFPSLDKLLAASDFLRSRWRREGNTVIKR
ncbi:MAG: NYN domain-containing protein [Chloroflexi bacterium]|nr:NYN domain-containing protein [Chloroflexota bacterium]